MTPNRWLRAFAVTVGMTLAAAVTFASEATSCSAASLDGCEDSCSAARLDCMYSQCSGQITCDQCQAEYNSCVESCSAPSSPSDVFDSDASTATYMGNCGCQQYFWTWQPSHIWTFDSCHSEFVTPRVIRTRCYYRW